MTKSGLSLLLLTCVIGLSGCTDAKKQLGLEIESPDEFLVVKRAPLEMPPDGYLHPPQPGIVRPQETSTNEQARETIFGEKAASPQTSTSSGESALLQQAGTEQTLENIRAIVDGETNKLKPNQAPVAHRLFGIGSDNGADPSSVIDAAAEAERLKKELEESAPIAE